MNFKQCNRCGNTDTSFVVLRCKHCKQFIGCFKPKSLMESVFRGDAKGCSGVEDLMKDKCFECRQKGGTFFNPDNFETFRIVE